MTIVKMGKYTVNKTRGKWVITHPDKMGKITVYGNGQFLDVFYARPDWSEEEEDAFEYKGETYFLSEFMRIDRNAPDWMRAFDGHHGDTWFSGILVKYNRDCDGIQVYTYMG